jgi:hypothetical protein
LSRPSAVELGSILDIRSVQVQGDMVSIAVSGEGEPPSFMDLVLGVRGAVGRIVQVDLEVTPSRELSTAQAAGGTG